MLENAPVPILVTELPIVTEASGVLAKVASPILSTEFGIATVVRPVNLNAEPPMLVTALPIVTVVSGAFSKADSPMLITESGITTEVSLVL